MLNTPVITVNTAAGLFTFTRQTLYMLAGPRFRVQPGESRLHKLCLLLLLVGGIEINPGPTRSLRFDSINANGVNSKDALLADLIGEHHLDVL